MWFVFSENPFARSSSVKCSGNFNGRHKESYVSVCERLSFYFYRCFETRMVFSLLPVTLFPLALSRPPRSVDGFRREWASDCPQRGEAAGGEHMGSQNSASSCLILGPEGVRHWPSRAGVRSGMQVQWEERELWGPPRNRPSRGSGECVERESPA